MSPFSDVGRQTGSLTYHLGQAFPATFPFPPENMTASDELPVLSSPLCVSFFGPGRCVVLPVPCFKHPSRILALCRPWTFPLSLQCLDCFPALFFWLNFEIKQPLLNFLPTPPRHPQSFFAACPFVGLDLSAYPHTTPRPPPITASKFSLKSP